MATVNGITKRIFVPQSDMTFVGGTLFALDTDVFRLELGNILWQEDGMPFVDAHEHTTEKTISGVTYARFVEIINNYEVEFEDGQYAVRLDGSNNNLFEEGVIIRNQVSVIPTNAAGLIVGEGGGGAEATRTRKHMTNRLETDPNTGVATLYDDDGVTPIETADLFEDVDGNQRYRGQGSERRDGFS